MKKIKLALVTLGIGVVGTGALSQIVQADDSQSTDTSVVVTPGELKIKSVDGIQFDAVKIDGKDKDITEKQGAKAKLSVEDFRGSSSKGWTLKAKLKDGNFNGMGLKLSPTLNTNKDASTAAPETQNLNTQDILIASISDDKIVNSEFDTEVQLNAKLNIPAKTKANSYTTTIVWNLAATPETK